MNTLQGDAINVLLSDGGTTVGYKDQAGVILPNGTKLMSKGGDSYYVQSTDGNGDIIHYTAGYESHSWTGSQTSKVDVTADTSNYFKVEDTVAGNDITSTLGTVKYLDKSGSAVATGENPTLVKDNTNGHYFVRKAEGGDTFYYKATVTSWNAEVADTADDVTEVQIDTDAKRLSTLDYSPITTLPQLSLGSASVSWQDENGATLDAANTQLVKATDGSDTYYVRTKAADGDYTFYKVDTIKTDVQNNKVVIKADTTSEKDFSTNDLSSVTSVAASNNTLDVNLSYFATDWQDSGGGSWSPGSNSTLVHNGSDKYVRTGTSGSYTYYEVTDVDADISSKTLTVKANTTALTSPPSSATAVSQIDNVSNPWASGSGVNLSSIGTKTWQDSSGGSLANASDYTLMTDGSDYYARFEASPGSYKFYKVDSVTTDVLSDNVTFKVNTATTYNFGSDDVVVETQAPQVTPATAAGLSAGQSLVKGSDGRYFVKDTSGGDAVYTPVTFFATTDNAGNSTINWTGNGLDRYEAAFNSASVVSTLPNFDLASATSTTLDWGSKFSVDENGQYYLRQVDADNATFHDAQAKTVMQSNGDFAVIVEDKGEALAINDVLKVSGESTVSLSQVNAPEVMVTYKSESGKTYANSITKDADGHYILNLGKNDHGYDYSVTLSKIDHLEDYLISQDGDLVVKVQHNDGAMMFYHAVAYTALTDAGNPSDYDTAVQLNVTSGPLRIRHPDKPLAAMDQAIAMIDKARSKLGAQHNRLESAIDGLTTGSNNMSAARSRIRDANYATQVSEMMHQQILQQVGTSMIAQANQSRRLVLDLLQG